MMAKQFFPEFSKCTPIHYSVPIRSLPDSKDDSILKEKFSLKRQMSPRGKKVPLWSFHECRDELITFTEKSKKAFPMFGTSSNIVY